MECRNCSCYDYGLGGQYCDKTGGKTVLYGYCTDAYCFKLPEEKKYSKQKRRNRRERDQKHKNHLKYLAENVSGYPSPVVFIDKIYVKGQGYIKIQKPYYKRYYRRQHSKYLKRMSNKKLEDIKVIFLRREIGIINYMISSGKCINKENFHFIRIGKESKCRISIQRNS